MPVSPTVLIVEDDPRIVDFMRKGLRASGFDVSWVATAGEARTVIEAGGVDVQILDLGLPDMDGLILLKELRDLGRLVPTVVVTARSDPRDRREALSLGARHYLTKPFAWVDLLEAVRDCSKAAAVEKGPTRPL
jgi:DNA-binding response OmpR family regulator